MAKTAPVKKKSASMHSRAARRAPSPGLKLEKSIIDTKPGDSSIHPRPVIPAAQEARISSKIGSRGGTILSTKARRRHKRGLDRAEAVGDRTATKIQKSRARARGTLERAQTWDAVNSEVRQHLPKRVKVHEPVQVKPAPARNIEVENSEPNSKVALVPWSSVGDESMSDSSVQADVSPITHPVEDEGEIL